MEGVGDFWGEGRGMMADLVSDLVSDLVVWTGKCSGPRTAYLMHQRKAPTSCVACRSACVEKFHLDRFSFDSNLHVICRYSTYTSTERLHPLQGRPGIIRRTTKEQPTEHGSGAKSRAGLLGRRSSVPGPWITCIGRSPFNDVIRCASSATMQGPH